MLCHRLSKMGSRDSTVLTRVTRLKSQAKILQKNQNEIGFMGQQFSLCLVEIDINSVCDDWETGIRISFKLQLIEIENHLLSRISSTMFDVKAPNPEGVHLIDSEITGVTPDSIIHGHWLLNAVQLNLNKSVLQYQSELLELRNMPVAAHKQACMYTIYTLCEKERSSQAHIY